MDIIIIIIMHVCNVVIYVKHARTIIRIIVIVVSLDFINLLVKILVKFVQNPAKLVTPQLQEINVYHVILVIIGIMQTFYVNNVNILVSIVII